MKLGLIASVGIALAAWTAPASADVSKILNGVQVQTVSRDAAKSLKAKGTYADYYGYYGTLYAYNGYYYGLQGYNNKSYSSYYSGYYYSYYATQYLYAAHYYQYYGY